MANVMGLYINLKMVVNQDDELLFFHFNLDACYITKCL
jgi:hypothetical protein